MITYNAQDLIQQATMMADLQNSDFISWKENIMFMDNAWTELYQKIINHADKTFLKEFTFKGGKTLLPDDFYQLYYVCYSDGTFERPISRRAKTTTNNGSYYDIVDNELVIYSKNLTLQNITVKYFPIKWAITYRNKMYDLSKRQNNLTIGNVIDTCNNYVITNTGMYDIINNVVIADGVSYFPTQRLFNNGQVISLSTDKYFKVDNNCYQAVMNGTTLTIKRVLSGSTKDYITVEDFPTEIFDSLPTGSLSAFTQDGIYFKDSDKLYFVDFISKNKVEYDDELVATDVVAYNNSIYYETVNGVCKDGEIVVDQKDYVVYNGLMKADMNTGYGILTDNYNLFGAFPDTELDFPNNFYYNYLAYRLAIYYKIKQGADPSGISALLSNAEKTFYDTLPRDENEFVRISNVYAY